MSLRLMTNKKSGAWFYANESEYQSIVDKGWLSRFKVEVVEKKAVAPINLPKELLAKRSQTEGQLEDAENVPVTTKKAVKPKKLQDIKDSLTT